MGLVQVAVQGMLLQIAFAKMDIIKTMYLQVVLHVIIAVKHVPMAQHVQAVMALKTEW